MIAFYVTHPQVAIDPFIPVPEWGLSDLGRSRLAAIVDREWVQSLTGVFSSTENKALEGAAILAAAVGCEVRAIATMGENDRSATGFLPTPEFERAADWFFANPAQSFHGWETAEHAQRRIIDSIEAAIASASPGNIAFIGHGGVGTLLKCHLGGLPISRSQDQLAGGGCVFAFSLSQRRLLCDWTPVETFEKGKLQ